MFLIIHRQTPVCSQGCIDHGSEFPHCTFSQSFIKVYTMMLGEVGDVNRYQQKTTSQFLYLAFVFLVVILLSNVLIALVTESNSIIKNERAEMVFWSNRLDFVAEMDSIVDMKKTIVRKILLCCGRRPSYEYTITNTSNHTTVTSDTSPEVEERGEGGGERSKKARCRPLYWLWSNMIIFLRHTSPQSTGEESFHFFELCLYFFLKFLVITIILPLWIALGVISAGWLFPPQVREWIFVMSENQDSTLLTSTVNMEDEIDLFKKEVVESRAEMTTELLLARKDCLALRKEMEEVKGSIKAEIEVVKDMTNALLRAYSRQIVSKKSE